MRRLPRWIRCVLGGAAILAVQVACDHGRLDEGPHGPEHIEFPLESNTSRKIVRAPTQPGAAALPAPADAEGTSRGDGIRGIIEVDPALIEGRRFSHIFVIARAAGASAGPPVAALKLPPGPFPLHFEIGPDDMMFKGRPFPETLSLSARLDQDGNAMTKAPGDIVGQAPGESRVGSDDVRILLDRPLP